MSKKKKEPFRARRPVRSTQLQFNDKTAERHLAAQLAKAERQYENKQYQAAIETLEPLVERYPRRPDLLELLGICYASANLLNEARDVLEEAVLAEPLSAGLRTRFNLAQLWLLTGYTFLAYEASLQIDPYILAREMGQPDTVERCRDFQADAGAIAELEARENGRELAGFLPYGLAMDRGRLAVERQDLEAAEQRFKEAARLEPAMPAPANNLALVYTLANRSDEAGTELERALELDPDNRTALTGQIRLAVSQGRPEQAQASLQRLLELPPPTGSREKLGLAEAYALLEDDGQVFATLRSLVEQRDELTGLERAAYEQTVLLAVIAAANLGHNSFALKTVREVRPFTHPTLLERTIFALENNERGPRAGGRFFYFDPVTAYPPAAGYFQQLAANLDHPDGLDYRAGLQAFFHEFGPAALEVAAYKYWIDREPASVADLLQQALASGVDGAEELVRRLAFSRSGDDLQRLTAARVLIEAGRLKPDQPLKIWLGQRQAVGTLAELQALYTQLAARETARSAPAYSQPVAQQLNEALDAMRRGEREQAIKLYRQIIETNPEVKHAYQNLAALLSGQGETGQAIEYLRQALEIDPDYIQARLALAQLWLSQGDLEQTAATLTEVRERVNFHYLDEAEAYYLTLASLCRRQGRPQEVRTALQELLRLDPGHELAARLLAETN